jgi:hypothetical protein
MSDAIPPRRFIPFRKADIVRMCLAGDELTGESAEAFHQLCRLLESLFHFEFQRVLEELKDCYAPFDPDADTRRIREITAEQRDRLHADLVAELGNLLESANFESITAQDLKNSMAVESLFKIRLEVDFADFQDVLFFQRGEQVRQETLVGWWGLKKRRIEFVNYERVLVYLRFKEQAYFDARGRGRLLFKPGATILKLFRNVPRADLEMLFPNSEIRMKTIDKLIIGVPAAVSGIVVLVSKLGASLVLLASLMAFWMGLREHAVEVDQKHLAGLGLGLLALATYLFKQIGKFKNRKLRFMKALTENLYFRNLDNNAGVLFRLVDAAEEEEFKEAVLAYFFLLTGGTTLTREALDRRVEDWLERKWNCRVNFEVDDALKKLERFGILRIDGSRLSCLPLEEARRRLDQIWDNFFPYHRPQEERQ